MASVFNNYRLLTCRMILEIRSLDHKQTHLKEGHPTLLSYLVDRHKLNAIHAKQLIKCFKLLSHIPDLLTHIKEGRYNLASASELHPFLVQADKATAQKMFHICKNRSSQEIRKIIDQISDTPAQSSSWHVLDKKIELIRNLFGHTIPQDLSKLNLLDYILTETLQRKIKKPISRARGHYISSMAKKKIWEKAHGQCQFIGANGRRCNSSFGLQVDHIIPISLGGSSQISNLRLLCSGHNQFMAQIKLGKTFMHPYHSKR